MAIAIAAAVGVLALVLVCAAAWVVYTPSGTRFAWRMAAPWLPGQLGIDAVEGRLAGPLRLAGVSLSTATLAVELDEAVLEWRPRHLLERHVEIASLRLTGLEVVMRPDADSPAADSAAPLAFPQRFELPVSVRVRDLLVDDARYRRSPEAEPQRLERARAAASLDDRMFTMERIEARGPRIELAGSGRLTPRRPFETEAALEWTIEIGELAPARGRTAVSGDLGALRVEQSLAPPYNLDARLLVGLLEGGIDLEGDVSVEPALREIGPELPAGGVSASIELDGSPSDLGLTVAADIDGAALGQLTLRADASLAAGRLELHSATLRHADSDAMVDVTASADLADPPRVELDVVWSALRWPLAGETLVASNAGRLGVSGSLDDYRLALEAELQARGTPGNIEIEGSGSRTRLSLPAIDLAVLGGTLTGSASVATRPALEAELELEASGIDPGALDAAWSGRLNGTLRARAGNAADTWRIELDGLDVSGRLRDRELDLEARGSYANGVASIDTLELATGESTVEAAGRYGQRVDVMFSLASPDLGDLWPGASGELRLSGDASGPREWPRVTLDGEGTALNLPGARFDSLRLSADVDLSGAGASMLAVRADRGLAGGTQIDSLELEAGGNAASHTLDFRAVTEPGNIAVALAGSLAAPWTEAAQWRFSLEQAAVAPAYLGAWALRGPSAGRAGAAGFELDETCWTQNAGAALCVAAERGNGVVDAVLRLSDLPFDYFAALMPDVIAIEGTLGATAHLELASGSEAEVEIELASDEGRLVPPEAGSAAVAFGPLQGRVVGRDGIYDAALDMPLPGRGAVELQARLGPPTPGSASPSVGGRLSASLDELDFVSQLSSQIDAVAGAVRGDLSLSGTLTAPVLTGELTLENGRATLPGANVTLEDAVMRLAGDADGDLEFSAGARSGDGAFEAGGRLELAAEGVFGEIEVSGADFEALNTPGTRVVISPELALTVDREQMLLTGEVRVPSARIAPRGARGDAVAASPDEVVVVDGQSGTAVGAASRPLRAEVTLALGDDVTIDAYGLAGELTGSIDITESPGEPTTASGELRVVDGSYEAYGQELEVRTGRVLFAGGAVTRPGLDIEAVRRPAEDILVGARVRGTLDQPELELFSEPGMQRQEQLSYLVLGRPLQGASSSEESALSRAALALGLRGGNFVSERVNESLGLDEFGIQTAPGEDATQAAFVIGKYLSPKLYVSYGVGLFEPVTTLNLRYAITDRWRLMTESSSEGSGGDVVYSIERSSD